MMRRSIVLVVFLTGIFCCSQGFGDITITQTYASRYISKGQDCFPDNDAAYHPSVDITFPALILDTDISLTAWGAFALSSGHEEFDEIDYSVSASKDIFEDWNVAGGYSYFDYPNANKLVDGNEVWGSLTWKKLPYLPVDTSMSLSVVYEFPAASGGSENGLYYSWGFETGLLLPDAAVFQKDQALTLGVVNWGTDGVGGRKSSKLYATVFSLSTEYVFGKMAFSPNFNYALNYENEINNGDEELWSGIAVSWSF
ncbi:MAG: hypothetical protein ISS47_04735 [Candidatus Omnitrophica bacterium]|nr:hypothetical protein [Candidatus Omnitrophota bacterium]